MEFTQETTSAINLGIPTHEGKLAQTHSKTGQGIKNVIFGSIAGMTGKLVEYPFDTVKTRLQAQPLDHKIFKGPLDCFKQTINHEGFWGLYRGMSSPMVGAMLENAMLFLVYNHIQMMIKEYTTPAYKRHLLYNKNFMDEISLDMGQLCLAGALSGALASFVLTPVELVKCKLQVQESFTYNNNSSTFNVSNKSTTIYTGPLSVIKHTLKQHGISGFFRGHTGTFIRETGGGAIWFGTYEFVSKLFMNQRAKMKGVDKNSVKKSDMSPLHLMTAGACAGMAYNILVFPADSVKSQMQTEEEMMQATGKIINKLNKRGFLTVAKDLYRADGIPGFYRGCGITVARAAPSSAIIFMTYVSFFFYRAY
ncbi:16844_t:CDS:2 [Dentiscutata erythropus]|uniref:16844_t:CDS:1 n=1 Tax=Dentiscutata erythropus TaxID=1348616 RepID=A0A9N8VBD9_9GLOM|nr:16844_t:CDS:2 [Dentiscutata erythropus]